MIAVDTSALIAICMGEAERDRFMKAMESAEGILISSGILVEARMVAFNKGKAELVKELDRLLGVFAIEIVPTDAEQAAIAHAAFVAYGKGQGHPVGLNFGDLFSYALAKARGVPLLYKSGDFARTDIAAAVSSP
jgi:ribonuclease VapC